MDECPTSNIVLCGEKTVYLLKNTEFDRAVGNFYMKRTQVSRFSDVKDEIFKMAVFDNTGSIDSTLFNLHKKLKGKLSIQRTGENWADIMYADVSKGNALAQLQLRNNVSWSETMAFGDYDNDISMLEKAYFSFAMENAVADVKKVARYTADSNKQYGVIKEIKCLFRMD